MPVQKSLNNELIEPPEGSIIDYISKSVIKARPEELEAVQPFSRFLVEELGYSVKQIQTHPQFQLKKGSQTIGRLDIAVFEDEKKLRDDLFIIVECKSSTRNNGLEQLKSYMNPSTAVIGVWFNGKEHLYLLKVIKD